MENSVQAMCQMGLNVWMTLKPGYLVEINFATLEVLHRIEILELVNEEVVTMVTIDEQFVIVCKSGLLIIVTTYSQMVKKKSDFLSLIGPKGSKQNTKISTIHVVSSQLNVVEVCKSQSTDQAELWCGCESGDIEIYISCSGVSKPQLKTILNTHVHSIPQNAGIAQLKSTVDGHTMYALHSCGSIITCWSVCEQPVLNDMIKLTQLSSPGRQA